MSGRGKTNPASTPFFPLQFCEGRGSIALSPAQVPNLIPHHHMNKYFDRPIDYKVEEVTLRRFDFQASVALDEDALFFTRHEWREDQFRQLRLTLSASIYGKEHAKVHIIRFPANWLEAVKERFAPAWMRDKWPVKFTEVYSTLEELYPGLEQALPDRNPILKCYVKKSIGYPIW